MKVTVQTKMIPSILLTGDNLNDSSSIFKDLSDQNGQGFIIVYQYINKNLSFFFKKNLDS